MKGFINILKAPNYTSSDVVVIIRGILKNHFNKKIKVGHLGTLDPGAAGVLPIAFNNATRLFDYYLKKDKLYRVSMKFGMETDTLDSYGKQIATSDNYPSLDQIENVISKFIGEIDQEPPLFSSISINGVRGYDLARKGSNITIPKRKVTINSININDYSNNTLEFDVSCSSGTYIRSLVRDIANALDSKAYLSYLIRLESGDFKIKNSVTIEEFKASIDDNLLNIEDYLSFMDKIYLTDQDEIFKLTNGVHISTKSITKEFALVYIDNVLIGIGTNINNKFMLKTRLS